MAKAGHPTKYNEEMLAKAKDYVKRGMVKENGFASIEELSLILGVNDDTIVEWTKKHEEFSATIKRLKVLQKQRLMSLGLDSTYNTAMSIFLLKANHGMMETEKRILDGNLSLKHSELDDDQLDKAIESKIKQTG